MDEEKEEPIEVPTERREPPQPKGMFDYSPEEWHPVIKTIFKEYLNLKIAGTRESKTLSYPVYIIIGIIFITTAILTGYKIISGESLTFLGGVIVGYLLSYLGEYVLSTSE